MFAIKSNTANTNAGWDNFSTMNRHNEMQQNAPNSKLWLQKQIEQTNGQGGKETCSILKASGG